MADDIRDRVRVTFEGLLIDEHGVAPELVAKLVSLLEGEAQPSADDVVSALTGSVQEGEDSD